MPSSPYPCSLRRLKKHELWWVAGLLEGEGCFTSLHVKRTDMYRFQIQMKNTDRSLCEALQEITGVGTVQGPSHTGRLNDNLIYSWYVYRHNDAGPLMRKLYPLMSTKRQAQIEKTFQQVGVQL